MIENFYDNVKHTNETMGDKKMPVIESRLRKRTVAVPEVIRMASGIRIFGKRISLITDMG